MTRTLSIAPELIETIRDAARRAHPNECCGLIEGVVAPDGWRATALHETKNLADNPAREFLIDPEVQFRLLRSLRGTERAIVGCFHSHPDHAPQPSDRDRNAAIDDNFLWLVAGKDAIGAYVFAAAEREFKAVTISRTE